MLPALFFLFRKTPKLQKEYILQIPKQKIVGIYVEIGPRNKLLAVWCVMCSEERTCRDARAVDGAGNSSGAATRDRAEREILHINGILYKHLRPHFSQYFLPSPHLTLYGPPGRYDPSAPTRTWCEWTTHRRTWQPCCYCPFGGGGGGVVLRTLRWSGYSVCYGLESAGGMGKGERGEGGKRIL